MTRCHHRLATCALCCHFIIPVVATAEQAALACLITAVTAAFRISKGRGIALWYGMERRRFAGPPMGERLLQRQAEIAKIEERLASQAAD